MPLEAKFAPRPAKVAGRVYPSNRPRVNCAFSGDNCGGAVLFVGTPA